MRQKIMNNGDKLEEACRGAQMCQWPLIAKFSWIIYTLFSKEHKKFKHIQKFYILYK